MSVCAAGFLLFLCLNSTWKQYAVAFFLLWGMVEWADAAWHLARMRMQFGMPWLRGALILLVVGLVTGLAGKYAYARAREKAAGRMSGRPLFQALVFMAVFLALFYLRQTAPMRFLLLERYFPLTGGAQIFLAAWYGAFISGRLLNPAKSPSTRRAVWLVFALFFFAQFALGLLGVEGMLLTGTLHVPVPAFIIFAPVFRDSLTVMPLIVLAATLLAGSSWCSMLCYFGPFDSLASGRKKRAPLPAFLQPALRYGRVFVLVTGVAAALLLRTAGISTQTSVSIAVAYAALSLMVMAVFSKKYYGMIHCATACPMGLVVNVLGRLSPWRMKVDPERCTHCGACEKTCKYNAVDAASRKAGKTRFTCTLCRDCVSNCGRKAITLHFPGLSPASAQKAFVGLVSVLHVIFLSVAMV